MKSINLTEEQVNDFKLTENKIEEQNTNDKYHETIKERKIIYEYDQKQNTEIKTIKEEQYNAFGKLHGGIKTFLVKTYGLFG